MIETTNTEPTPQPPPQPAPAPAQPPAALTVVNGRTEREVELEAQLESERSARRKAETDAAYAQDEARRLKEIQSGPHAPAAATKITKSRWTLLHDEAED